jgi:hypothetical protein
MTSPRDRGDRALNILAKWRVLLTGWQLGTRPKGDPEGDAVRDHREATLLLRAELNAVIALLLEKGMCTEDDLWVAVERSAADLSAGLEERFPGVTAHEYGLTFDRRTLPWMKGWKP